MAGVGTVCSGAGVYLFIYFTEAAAESHLKLLSTVAQAVKGQGTICWVDCGYDPGNLGHGGWRARGGLWWVGWELFLIDILGEEV